jgi:hypothetical protein
MELSIEDIVDTTTIEHTLMAIVAIALAIVVTTLVIELASIEVTIFSSFLFTI